MSLKDLDGVKWVLPAGGSAFRRQLENMFATAGIGWPTRAINTNSILAIKAIVMSSDCVTIMSPRLVEVEREIGRISTIALTDVGPLRPVGLMWRANDELSPIAARFADVLRRVARGSAA